MGERMLPIVNILPGKGHRLGARLVIRRFAVRRKGWLGKQMGN